MSTAKKRLVLAVPKGRIRLELNAIFERAGYALPRPEDDGRRLSFDAPELPFEVLLLRGHDVPTFVSEGVADFGVTGLDVLLEHPRPLYAPLDLGVGRCRMCLIAMPGFHPLQDRLDRPLRVATKFPGITRKYLAQKKIPAQVISLHGNIELAPIKGLSDCVVDLVSTGSTLKRNGLVEVEHILDVSARVICNRAAYRLQFTEFDHVLRTLRSAIKSAE